MWTKLRGHWNKNYQSVNLKNEFSNKLKVRAVAVTPVLTVREIPSCALFYSLTQFNFKNLSKNLESRIPNSTFSKDIFATKMITSNSPPDMLCAQFQGIHTVAHVLLLHCGQV